MTAPPYDAAALREGHLALDVYQQFAVATDRSARSGERRLRFHLLGLFGEVGSLLSELKKKQRDHNSYAAYERSSVEETGDVLWYLANVADALNLRLSDLAARLVNDPSLFNCSSAPTSFHDLEGQQSLGLMSPASGEYVERSLLDVAARVGRLIRRANEKTEGADALREDLSRLFHSLVTAAADAQISLESSARSNIDKVDSRWPIERVHTPLFDEEYDEDERLPRQLEVVFREKEVLGVRYVFQSVHGVNLGDRLTDNSADQDDYRFHDVFHLAYAAVLGWSPVLRALLKLKRKSNRAVDEEQDGARAIITEEGISNWIFSYGLRHQAFADVTTLDFELLRTIHQMVRGYEVQQCPMWMWEDAILQGFRAFRHLKEHRAGTLVADLEARRLVIKEP